KYQRQSMEVFAEIDRVDFELVNQAERLAAHPPRVAQFKRISLAAAGESYLSPVYDASRQLPQNILKALASGKLPGKIYESAKLENRSGEAVWSLLWEKTGRNVIFWDVRNRALLGVGTLVPGKECSYIYLRADLRTNSDAPICAADVAIFLGK
ncbi:MAG: hypothetical protein MJ016_01235, partial [Victivallaceae bacterium]|nr:hypothetical protein [Victivallaceae bacterium]